MNFLIKFPFRQFVTDKGELLKIIGIYAPFRSDIDMDMYNMLKNEGYEFVGMSNYSEFPGKISNPYDDKYHVIKHHNYQSMVKTWLHCFRDPDFIKIPKLFISNSDFTDYNSVISSNSVHRKYDLIYVCQNETNGSESGWQSYIRNWSLAKKCIEQLCNNYKVHVLIIGREKSDISCGKYGTITKLPFQPYEGFINLLKQSKILFVPNIYDASPRVLTQALCCDTRVLVNKNIIGGWKYVCSYTGEFFTSEYDFMAQYNNILQNYNNYSPRSWYKQHYGIVNSGTKLLEFMKKYYKDPKLKYAKYIRPKN